MTTQKAVSDILKNLICDNGKLVIEKPITAEKVEIIKNTILQQPIFQGINLPSITDEMISKITSSDENACSTAIDGLVNAVEGTSPKSDFNDIVSDGKMIDDVLGAIKDATCNCSPVVSEFTPIIAYLEQIRKANLEKKEKITLTKTDGKNKLSNDTDWVSALNGIVSFPQSLLQGTLRHWFMFFGECFSLLFRINPRPQSPLRAFERL